MFAPPDHLRYIDELPMFPLEKYTLLDTIGDGGFGNVRKASLTGDESAGQFAVKTTLMRKCQGIVTNYDRSEIHALTLLKDEENVIKLVDLVKGPRRFSIVMELCSCDLDKVITNNRIPINLYQIKNILKQFFNGLRAIHSKNIMHRDIKPANVLLTSDGKLKIADFGLSLQWDRGLLQSCDVCTLWYKAPELLLGDTEYREKIDMWGAGCMATELWTRKVLFKGMDGHNQMREISRMCGFLSHFDWPRAERLPNYDAYRTAFGRFQTNSMPNHLTLLTHNDLAAVSLLGQLLKLNPSKRIDAQRAYDHYFFDSDPLPSADLKNIVELVQKYLTR